MEGGAGRTADEVILRPLSRIPVALAAGGMHNLNNPCYYEIHTKAINTFV